MIGMHGSLPVRVVVQPSIGSRAVRVDLNRAPSSLDTLPQTAETMIEAL
jgi:hypothetical protein